MLGDVKDLGGGKLIATVNEAVIRKALSWSRPDFEDAVQMAAAVHAGADYLIIHNPRDFQEGIIQVVQPGPFLALLR